MENFFAGMFSPEWLAALSGILLLDLLLSGDNAILIALACKNLPHEMRRKAIIVGGLGAVFVRIVCTLFATGLLASPYIEFIGGAALVVIAVKLVTDHSDGRVEDGGSHPTTFGQAVRTILVADFIMSIDNILSLAGVARSEMQKPSTAISTIGSEKNAPRPATAAVVPMTEPRKPSTVLLGLIVGQSLWRPMAEPVK